VNGLPYRPGGKLAAIRLGAHAWRGNVRELENIVHRAVLLAEGDEIGPEAVELSAEAPSPAAGGVVSGGVSGLVGRRVEDVERDLIIETLGHTLGIRTHAATILGISIRALRNKLRDYAAQGVAVPPPAAGVAA
jgi:two-component system response regulator FlrC